MPLAPKAPGARSAPGSAPGEFLSVYSPFNLISNPLVRSGCSAQPGGPSLYKDPGGPAQLGTRDWAGLMGPTVIWLATEGRSEPPRGRVLATSAGTERQKVGLGWVIIRFNFNNGSNAIECKGMSH